MDVRFGQTTWYPKQINLNRSKWILIDAENEVMGRLASKVSSILMGKNYPQYTPGALIGDCVIVINVDKMKITGHKITKKEYHNYSGYKGGLRTRVLEKIELKEALMIAIKGMLPKNARSRHLLTRLRLFSDATHNMEAQKPIVYKINYQL